MGKLLPPLTLLLDWVLFEALRFINLRFSWSVLGDILVLFHHWLVRLIYTCCV